MFELQFCFVFLVVLLVNVFGAAVIVWGGYSAFRCEFLVFCSLACVCVCVCCTIDKKKVLFVGNRLLGLGI